MDYQGFIVARGWPTLLPSLRLCEVIVLNWGAWKLRPGLCFSLAAHTR